jgi:hypothetical protein
MIGLMAQGLPSLTPWKTETECWIACKAGQTARRLERILFGELSSLTPFSHSPKIPISFYLDADILFLRPFSGLFDREQVKNGAVFPERTLSGMRILFALGK